MQLASYRSKKETVKKIQKSASESRLMGYGNKRNQVLRERLQQFRKNSQLENDMEEETLLAQTEQSLSNLRQRQASRERDKSLKRLQKVFNL